ncbi:sugar O-acetyltransferase [Methylocella sp.]|uniref:sugar O-acetyltransferase n=1 Tax=Methylocella sp. TaxID=1978226 RepID=UPI003784535E
MPGEMEKMLAGALYRADDAEIAAAHARACAFMARYNGALDATREERAALLRDICGAVGENVVVRPPFHCDYGFNIFLGDGVFLNFNCVILDVCTVRIGALTQIGPGVQILAADHPRDPLQRRALLESGKPVTIGENCWIGAGALILPGVAIADDAIVGAGAVVTRDVAKGATVAGNPARAIRTGA